MADIAVCPRVFDAFSDVAEVVELPAENDVLPEQIADLDAHLASRSVPTDRNVLEYAIRLRVIATPATGLYHIDLDNVRERGIESQAMALTFTANKLKTFLEGSGTKPRSFDPACLSRRYLCLAIQSP